MKTKLIEILIANGVEKAQAEKIVSENKIYSQEQVDDIANKARETIEKKMEEKINTLANDYNQLQKQIKTKEIKDNYIKLGGREEFFDDFIKINEEKLQDNSMLENAMYKSSWCFGEQKHQDIKFSESNPNKLTEKALDDYIEKLTKGE